MSEQDQEFMNQIVAEIEQLKQNQGGQYPAPVSFGGGNKTNLVEWQLNFSEELAEIEHLLRNDLFMRDEKNNEIWVRNKNSEEVIFNDRGVNEIIKEIRMFLNKNTVLSNYQADEIRLRLRNLGHELRALIYNNYEAYGLDTEYKLNHYPMMVITILSMIESAYRRALNGEERRDLNSARQVTQTEPIGSQHMSGYPMMMMQQPSKKKLWNPFSWAA